jgi:hypothetical protein
MKVACGNCSWKGDVAKTDDATRIYERHEIGVIYSNVQCPKCQALCYPTDIKHEYPFLAPNDHAGWASWLKTRIGQKNAVAVANALAGGKSSIPKSVSAVLREALGKYRQEFAAAARGEDAPINGGDLLEWFAQWRIQARRAMRAVRSTG